MAHSPKASDNVSLQTLMNPIALIHHVGFGIYTAVDIPASDIVIGSESTVLPVFTSHLVGRSIQDYVWNSRGFAQGGDDIGVFYTSFMGAMLGALGNAHAGIVNTKISKASGTPDHALDRSVDPGAGAFSPYPSFGFASQYPINAGEELFVSYGEHWYGFLSYFGDFSHKRGGVI